MINLKDIKEYRPQKIAFSKPEDVLLREAVVNKAIEVGCVASYDLDNGKGMVNKFSMENYNQENKDAKEGIIAFACEKAGIKMPENNAEVMEAFDNVVFNSIFNSIQKDVIMGIMTRVQSPQIMAMANIETVDVGSSFTWEIDAKGLPVAQRDSYMSNVTIDQTAGMKSITITPKVYSLGVTLDYTRIIANDYDFGKQIAKVALGMLYAQHKLIVGLIFDTTKTPLYQATFDQLKYVTMADDIKALNGGAEVMAYATRVALSKLGASVSTNGFLLKDEFIKQGYIGSPYGVPTVIIDQATDFSTPLVGGEIASRLVPNDKMVLLSGIGDKPVKLVRENYIRIIQQDNLSGSMNKVRYSYFMAFDAGLATQQHFGIQAV